MDLTLILIIAAGLLAADSQNLEHAVDTRGFGDGMDGLKHRCQCSVKSPRVDMRDLFAPSGGHARIARFERCSRCHVHARKSAVLCESR